MFILYKFFFDHFIIRPPAIQFSWWLFHRLKLFQVVLSLYSWCNWVHPWRKLIKRCIFWLPNIALLIFILNNIKNLYNHLICIPFCLFLLCKQSQLIDWIKLFFDLFSCFAWQNQSLTWFDIGLNCILLINKLDNKVRLFAIIAYFTIKGSSVLMHVRV